MAVGIRHVLWLDGVCSHLLVHAQEVGNAFVQHYYQIFDSNRANLQGLYQVCSRRDACFILHG